MNTQTTINIKEFDALNIEQKESFIAHTCADIVQGFFISGNRKGLEVIIKNLSAILERAKDCLSCIDMLNNGGDVFSKILLLLEYAGRNGLSEEFVDGLIEITERAQESLAQKSGVVPAGNEERKVLERLRAVMDRKNIAPKQEISDIPA